jgi:RNA polymerase sigma-70 factor, ECF subfamily
MTATVAISAADERRLVAALRSGDEQAFSTLVESYHPSLVRVAQTFVRDRAAAEEVAQEAWMGVIRGIDRFRGDSSLKTWIFRILTNRAKSYAARTPRAIPFSALPPEADEPSVNPERFLGDDHPVWPGHWASAPANWQSLPEERLLAGETLDCIKDAIATLPETQQQVVTLRDVEGWSSDEVCDLLRLTETNQRVLLHRGRSKIRAALETYFASADTIA